MIFAMMNLATQDLDRASIAHKIALDRKDAMRKAVFDAILSVHEARTPMQRWIRERAKLIHVRRMELALDDVRKKTSLFLNSI